MLNQSRFESCPRYRTLLIVTHDLPFAAELCERAVILSAGRLVADAGTDAVLADAGLLAAHDLELPAGLDLDRIVRRGRPGERESAPHPHEPSVSKL